MGTRDVVQKGNTGKATQQRGKRQSFNEKRHERNGTDTIRRPLAELSNSLVPIIKLPREGQESSELI